MGVHKYVSVSINRWKRSKEISPDICCLTDLPSPLLAPHSPEMVVTVLVKSPSKN